MEHDEIFQLEWSCQHKMTYGSLGREEGTKAKEMSRVSKMMQKKALKGFFTHAERVAQGDGDSF